jgi:hypothetical protein
MHAHCGINASYCRRQPDGFGRAFQVGTGVQDQGDTGVRARWMVRLIVFKFLSPRWAWLSKNM